MSDDPRYSRRLSVQHPSSATFPFHNPTTHIPDSGVSRTVARRSYGTPEQMPTSMTFDRGYPPPQGLHAPTQGSSVSLDWSSNHQSSRRSSTDTYGSYSNHSLEHPHVRHPAYQPGVRLHLPSREEFGPRLEETGYGRSEYPTSQQAPLFAHRYEPAQSAYFMPSQYEYQHGKARKRSNLPKQSTEIMKTWFDQVSPASPCMVLQRLC